MLDLLDLGYPTPGTTKQIATGGTVTYTPTGLIHKAGNKYGAEAEKDLTDLD
jgi:hypothetical protein